MSPVGIADHLELESHAGRRIGRCEGGGAAPDRIPDPGLVVAARDAGRLKTPLKSHGWLYEVISSYRPQAGQVMTDGAPRLAASTIAGQKASSPAWTAAQAAA